MENVHSVGLALWARWITICRNPNILHWQSHLKIWSRPVGTVIWERKGHFLLRTQRRNSYIRILTMLNRISGCPWFEVAGKELVPTYFVRKPVAWNDLLFRRVENHMVLYNLYTSYAVHAAEEITGRSGIWHVFLDRCGEDFLAASFHDEAVSREQLFLNSWQSALYRGLEEHIDFVTQWLRLWTPPPNPNSSHETDGLGGAFYDWKIYHSKVFGHFHIYDGNEI